MAAAGTAIRAVRMPVLLSVRLQPAGAAAVPVLRGVPAAAGTHAHQTARPDARIAVRPHAHRPAILPARTSALAVRNKRNSETKIYNRLQENVDIYIYMCIYTYIIWHVYILILKYLYLI